MFGPVSNRNPNYNSAIFTQNSQPSGFNSLFFQRQQQESFPGGALPFGRSQSESAFRGRGQGREINAFSQQQSSNNFQNGLSESKRNLHNNISTFVSQHDANFSEAFKDKPTPEANP